jgi:hypothetical protein
MLLSDSRADGDFAVSTPSHGSSIETRCPDAKRYMTRPKLSKAMLSDARPSCLSVSVYVSNAYASGIVNNTEKYIYHAARV